MPFQPRGNGLSSLRFFAGTVPLDSGPIEDEETASAADALMAEIDVDE